MARIRCRERKMHGYKDSSSKFRAAKVMTFSITGDSDDRIGRDLSGVDLFIEELVRPAVLATSFDLS